MRCHFTSHPELSEARYQVEYEGARWVSEVGIIWRDPNTGKCAGINLMHHLEDAWHGWKIAQERESETS